MVETIVAQSFERYLEERRSKQKDSWRKHLSHAWDRFLYKDEPEFLDSPDMPIELRLSIVEGLSRLNDRSGYTRVFIKELEKLIQSFPKNISERPLRIVDVGAGGGGLLKAIYRWARLKRIQVELFGIDLSNDFSKITQSRLTAEGIPATIIQGDACSLKAFGDQSFDVVVSSYMVHHLRSPGKVALFFSEVYRIARQGWLIVDFDRRYYAPLFALMGGLLFGGRPLLVLDGVRSSRRAYQDEEINFLLEEARKAENVNGMHCQPHPVFPYWKVQGIRHE